MELSLKIEQETTMQSSISTSEYKVWSQKNGECLNFKQYSKRYIAIKILKILISNTNHTCHFRSWSSEVLFRDYF